MISFLGLFQQVEILLQVLLFRKRNPIDTCKLLVVQYSPAVAVSVAELLGFKHGTDMSGIINAVLRRYGFDRVFDSSFGNDLLIIEESRIFEEHR